MDFSSATTMASVGAATVVPAIHSHNELSNQKPDEQDYGLTTYEVATPTPQPLLDGNTFGRFKAAAGILTPSTGRPITVGSQGYDTTVSLSKSISHANPLPLAGHTCGGGLLASQSRHPLARCSFLSCC